MDLMLLGAIAMACFMASLFFLSFWKTTRDRFFLFFAVSFGLEGCSRILLGLSYYSNEQAAAVLPYQAVCVSDNSRGYCREEHNKKKNN